MNPLSLSGLDDAVVGFLVATLLCLALWLGWRRPTMVLPLALAALAVRPELLWGGPHIGYEWGLHQALLVVALTANALHFGIRRSINWPVAALTVIFGLNLLFGDLHPDLTIGFMLTSLAILTLPFAFTQVVLAPNCRRVYTLVIALTPVLSVAIGAALQLAGIRTTFAGFHHRLEGATGNSAVFAALAFAGFAVALHEWTRQDRLWAIALAAVNCALVILSGTRMAILASAVLLVAYVLASQQFRDRLRRSPAMVLVAICLVAIASIPYMEKIHSRMFEGLTGRPEVWKFFYDQFWLSPVFGRGIGSGFIAGKDLLEPHLPTPHNEYLHLLVIGGAVGFILCIVGIILWYRQLTQAASSGDRGFLTALAPVVAMYAMTDNILLYSSALALFAYLGMICQATALSSSIRIAGDVRQPSGVGATARYDACPLPVREGDGGRSR